MSECWEMEDDITIGGEMYNNRKVVGTDVEAIPFTIVGKIRGCMYKTCIMKIQVVSNFIVMRTWNHSVTSFYAFTRNLILKRNIKEKSAQSKVTWL